MVSVCSLYFSQSLIPRTDKAVLAVNGFAADGNIFVKRLRQRLEVCLPLPVFLKLVFISYAFHLKKQWYRHAHSKEMPIQAIARLIQTMLYGQRFFPYYIFNILGGIEEDGAFVRLYLHDYT